MTLAGGAVTAKFLKFEEDAPPVAAQTAYGITAVVEGYEEAYDPKAMLFMDYRCAPSSFHGLPVCSSPLFMDYRCCFANHV